MLPSLTLRCPVSSNRLAIDAGFVNHLPLRVSFIYVIFSDVDILMRVT
jgi:hypothetical protein